MEKELLPVDAESTPSSVPSPLHLFRPIHYLGSKFRIVHEIIAAIDGLDPRRGRVCDLFSGSATVALALSHARPTTAVDIQEYSRVLSSAILHPRALGLDALRGLLKRAKASKFAEQLHWAAEPIVAYEKECLELAEDGHLERICELVDEGSPLAFRNGWAKIGNPDHQKSMEEFWRRLGRSGLDGHPASTVVRYFGGVYFSYEQAVALDIVLDAVHCADPNDRDFLLAMVLSTASDLVNTVGRQFAQPIRLRKSDGTPKKHLISKCLGDRSHDVALTLERWNRRYISLAPSGFAHAAIKGDYVDVLGGREMRGVSVVYADPPYTRDHYSRFYHVLETMCLRDNPEVSKESRANRSFSRGLYRMERHQSPFCIKSKAEEAFISLVEGVSHTGAALVLSYSPYTVGSLARPRLMTVSALVSIAKKSYSHVDVYPLRDIVHSKLNAAEFNASTPSNAEVLLLCR